MFEFLRRLFRKREVDTNQQLSAALVGRKSAEESLRQAEEHFQQLVGGVADYAIFLLDAMGHVVSWNTGAERINGYTAREIIGQHFSRFYPPEAVERGWPDEELRLAAANGRIEDEAWRLRKDGSPYWANVVITALHDERGSLRGFLKVTRDLTERKRAEEALRQAHAELEDRVRQRTAELQRANTELQAEIAERERLEQEVRRQLEELVLADRHKNEFLAMLAHELRNPMAPLRNALHLLKMPGTDSEIAREARDVMERQVKHLVRMVDDLLDISRIVCGRIELRRESVKLQEVVERAVELAQPVIDAQGHELIVTRPAQPVWLNADCVRLAQVISNLLTNAAKYTEKAGRIWLTAGCEDGLAVVRVRDNGIGITPELLPRIFELFVQGDRSLERTQGGLGIGLTLVRRIVELHGGSVTASSAGTGQGSEFVVRLPALVEEPVTGEQGEPTSPPREAVRPRRILVVDDSVDGAESTAMLLRLWGHTVRTLHDGLSVLATAREFRPEFILLDIGLPGMSGYDVAMQLRAQRDLGELVLVAITGYGQPEDRHRSREAGFDHHLTKPLDPRTLRALTASPHEFRAVSV